MGVQALLRTYRLTFVLYIFTISLTLAALLWPCWAVDETHTVTVGLTKRCTSEPYLRAQTCTSFPIEHSDTMAAGDLQASPAPPTPVPITPPPSASSGDDPMKAGWQTASFVTWITLFLQLATVISHASTVVGGRYFAEMGWRLISDFAAASVLMQTVSLVVVRLMVTSSASAEFFAKGLSDRRDREGPGGGYRYSSKPIPTVPVLPLKFEVGMSWYLALASCLVALAGLVTLIVMGMLNPPEHEYYLGDYVRIDDGDEEYDEEEYLDGVSEYTDATTTTTTTTAARQAVYYYYPVETVNRKTFYDYFDENHDEEEAEEQEGAENNDTMLDQQNPDAGGSKSPEMTQLHDSFSTHYNYSSMGSLLPEQSGGNSQHGSVAPTPSAASDPGVGPSTAGLQGDGNRDGGDDSDRKKKKKKRRRGRQPFDDESRDFYLYMQRCRIDEML